MEGEDERDERTRVLGELGGLERDRVLNLNITEVGRWNLGSCWHFFKHLVG